MDWSEKSELRYRQGISATRKVVVNLEVVNEGDSSADSKVGGCPTQHQPIYDTET
jgi:uncharacterized protein YwqG